MLVLLALGLLGRSDGGTEDSSGVGAADCDPVPGARLDVVDAVDFGEVSRSTTVRRLDLASVGTEDLVVCAIALEGDAFTLVASPAYVPIVLAPGAVYPMEVAFTPEDVGTSTGAVRVVSNDQVVGEATVELSGVAAERGR